jgi:hypothetical protein
MISEYKFGKIIVNGKVYTHDLIIMAKVGVIVENWWRKEGHLLQFSDLKEVIENKPNTLIIGTGAHSLMRVPQELVDELTSQGIDVIVKPTREACEIYNKLRDKPKVIAALHLTC